VAGVMRDWIAGVQLAGISIPESMGYAAIAGMPAVTGMYTLFLPMLAFAAFGASRFLVVASDSATAAILAAGISGMAPAASERYIALAGTVALLTAALLLIARILRLGFLADFLSRTVLIGFLTGVGVQVGIGVLGHMFGVEVHARRTVWKVVEIAGKFGQINWESLGIAAVVIVGVLLFERFAPRVPAVLIAVCGAIAASAKWDFAGHGISVIGPVAGGLPHFRVPWVGWGDLETLLPVAASCVVMIVAQSAATARNFAQRYQQRPDENADLGGLAAANAAAALSGTFVVNGSVTQTSMAEGFGGRSQMTACAVATMVLIVLLFLTGPIQYLPHCVLGAIVFLVAIRLLKVRELRDIRKESPGEFILALTTAGVVVLVGVEQGILLAMVLSLLRIVRHSYRPHTAVLVQGKDGIWELKPAASGAMAEPGLVVYRFGAALFYANVGMFCDEVRRLAGTSGVRWIVVDAGAITNVDFTAAHAIRELQQELTVRHVELVIAHVQSDLKPDLDRHYLTVAIGVNRIFDTLHDALAAYRAAVVRA
jgi:MFS superfamily sulfate permease-like transporter